MLKSLAVITVFEDNNEIVKEFFKKTENHAKKIAQNVEKVANSIVLEDGIVVDDIYLFLKYYLTQINPSLEVKAYNKVYKVKTISNVGQP